VLSSNKILTGSLIAWFLIMVIWAISFALWGNCTPVTGPGDVPCDPMVYGFAAIWLQWSHFAFAAGFVLLFVFFLIFVVKLIQPAFLHGLLAFGGACLLMASLYYYAIYAPLVMTAFDQIGWFGFILGEFGMAIWFEAQPLVWVWILWGSTFGYTFLALALCIKEISKLENLEHETTGATE
jgi:hypothetical protein